MGRFQNYDPPCFCQQLGCQEVGLGIWCASFRDLWVSSWGPWADAASSWWEGASPDDKHHTSCLRVPLSFVESLPPEFVPSLREHVAHHQYVMLLGARALQGSCRCPRTSVAAWYRNLGARHVKPKPLDKNLWEHVLYKPKKRNTKQKALLPLRQTKSRFTRRNC